jgi:D-alanyl-D-alanine carboxypeptidase
MKKTLLSLGLALGMGLTAQTVSADDIPMFRLYNANSGEHFYTQNKTEALQLINKTWQYEGVGWLAPSSSSQPVYRLYNPNAGDHHYTLNSHEKDQLVSVGWRYEGIGWYSSATTSSTQPLFRAYNKNAKAGSHNYTTSQHEQNTLIQAGWAHEGLAWHGVPGKLPSFPELEQASKDAQAAAEAAKEAERKRLSATGATVLNTKTGKFLHSKNGDMQLPLASASKLVVVYRVYEAVKQGKLRWDQGVAIPANIGKDAMWCDKVWLRTGNVYNIHDLVKLALLPSSNQAATLLGIVLDGSNTNYINNTTKWLQAKGLKSFNYVSASGLELTDLQPYGLGLPGKNAPTNATPGSYNTFTPHEFARFTQKLISDYPQVLEISNAGSAKLSSGQVVSSSCLVSNYNGADFLGLKTGFTNVAKNAYVGVADYKSTRYVTIVFQSYDKFGDTKKLVDNWIK